MTWAEFSAARRLLIEERVGRHVRAQLGEEDAKFQASLKAARKAG